MKHEPQYWIIWCENGSAPTRRHKTYASAKSEAIRLARTAPGKRFVVFAAAAAFVKDDVVESRFGNTSQYDLHDDIPF